jgi:hypothetical protein
MVEHGRLEMSWSMLLPSRDGLFTVRGGFDQELCSFQLCLEQLARDRII